MKVYTKKSGHGHHIVDVFAEGDNGAYFNIARCTTTNVEAVDSMNAMFLGSGGFYETQGEAKQALIDEALEKGFMAVKIAEMAREEFDKAVKSHKEAMLLSRATSVLSALQVQEGYRNYGIGGLSFDELITEIAQADVLGIGFMDTVIDLDKMVAEWYKESYH